MNDTDGFDRTPYVAMSPQSVLRVRSPADLVEAVPYLIGVRPTDSVVLLGILPGDRSRVGPVLRHDLPAPADFANAARHFARLLVRTGARGVAVAIYADGERGRASGAEVAGTSRAADASGGAGASEALGGSAAAGGSVAPEALGALEALGAPEAPEVSPAPGFSSGSPLQDSGRTDRPAPDPGAPGSRSGSLGGLPGAVGRLRPLHDAIARECAALGVEVREAVCVTAGRWWSYGCADVRCCPVEGTPLRTERNSTVAATAVWAGLPEPASLADLVRLFRPPEYAMRERILRAYTDVRGDSAGFEPGRTLIALAGHRVRFRAGDTEIEPEEAARLVLGLGDARVRDEVMAWHGETPGEADDRTLLALWTVLARRAFAPASAPPLTLAAWAAWTAHDGVLARVAVTGALRADPGYTMARLLHSAINSPLSAAEVRRRIFRDAVTNRAP
ncbi:DUF4192 domain-containing protein [Embleya hyalina]|uniref:DUF4192 domain-containing protein n=1 Tax=Embleya hyalina TaxID=516124 RepID=A0A401YZ89_9ACTN|nr:DUF4192 domain-containing protein [Embleya hyalina]GCD99952.1 hypothetical protein EHYA_07676 [Embleya hyalina]